MGEAISSVLALDVGGKRVGVAAASLDARLARPLTTIEQGEGLFETLQQLIDENEAERLIIGLPRGLDGQHTAQTAAVEQFVSDLSEHIAIPVTFQDEAVTSRQAEKELESRGKPYVKGDIDALAATYILEDWLAGQQKAAA